MHRHLSMEMPYLREGSSASKSPKSLDAFRLAHASIARCLPFLQLLLDRREDACPNLNPAFHCLVFHGWVDCFSINRSEANCHNSWELEDSYGYAQRSPCG